MKVSVDPNKCIACGACVSIAPESFSLNEKDLDAVTIPQNPPKNSLKELQDAKNACPTKAIKIQN